ncbi:MAG TPA: PilZ domain-containing protein [Gemmataceae bacterium]|nr:PilZ domain-containing protein [Gemmataceae bacterium]
MTDRRRSVRVAPGPATSCDLLAPEGHNRWEAGLFDLSRHGACVLIGPRFQPGSDLVLELRGDRGGLAAHVQVVHSVIECPNGAWLTGVAFAHLPDVGDLEEFVRPVRGRPDSPASA